MSILVIYSEHAVSSSVLACLVLDAVGRMRPSYLQLGIFSRLFGFSRQQGSFALLYQLQRFLLYIARFLE